MNIEIVEIKIIIQKNFKINIAMDNNILLNLFNNKVNIKIDTKLNY